MKRLLALFLSLVLMLCAAVPAYATGDGNFDGGGGGMGSGTSTNYWNPGMDGVRISVVNVDSHAVVGNTIDWSNQNPSTNMIHFGKVSKLSYIKMFAGGRPITVEEYNALTAVRMENTGKVCGVFDVNFDKREFSAVHIMDGWQTWAMRDVSVASYHATRSYFASADEQWRKLLNHLNGKEITSAGHLSAQNFSFGEEINDSDGQLNFYLQADFDVDAAFGTFVCTDQNDDWLNIYANYDVEQDRLCNTLDLNLCKGDGSEEDWSYPLNAADQEVLLCKMEAFCQQQTGMSLHEYARQLRDSETQAPEMQM